MTATLRTQQATNPKGLIDAKFKFDSLTSLRGIAALCTVLIHLVTIWAGAFPAIKDWTHFQKFASNTYLFVDFFFVLSGFVMSHAYGKVFINSVTFSDYLKFIRARFARVYPLHFVLLALYVGLAIIGIKQEQKNPDWSIAANIFLVHAMGFFSHPTWNQSSWSISVEWWTYVVFPFFMPLAQRYIRGNIAALCLMLSISMFMLFSSHFGSANLTVGYAFIRCLIGFFAGLCIYSIVMARRYAFPANIITKGILAAIFLLLTLTSSPIVDVLVFIGFCALVCVTSKNLHEQEWLRRRILVWVGDISYSIYLWHTLLLHVFMKVITTIKAGNAWSASQQATYFIFALILFEVCIVFVAHISYKFIELPTRNFLNPGRTVQKFPLYQAKIAGTSPD